MVVSAKARPRCNPVSKGYVRKYRSHPAFRDFRKAKLQEMRRPFCSQETKEKMEGESVLGVPPLLFSSLVE